MQKREVILMQGTGLATAAGTIPVWKIEPKGRSDNRGPKMYTIMIHMELSTI
jgi:hypothetical protein